MKKILKKIGSSLAITFTKEEKIIHNMEVGDIVDISDIIVTKQVKGGNKKR